MGELRRNVCCGERQRQRQRERGGEVEEGEEDEEGKEDEEEVEESIPGILGKGCG